MGKSNYGWHWKYFTFSYLSRTPNEWAQVWGLKLYTNTSIKQEICVSDVSKCIRSFLDVSKSIRFFLDVYKCILCIQIYPMYTNVSEVSICIGCIKMYHKYPDVSLKNVQKIKFNIFCLCPWSMVSNFSSFFLKAWISGGDYTASMYVLWAWLFDRFSKLARRVGMQTNITHFSFFPF